MSVQKIKSGRIPTVASTSYVGERGIIFYEESLGDLRLSDGETPGGIPISLGSSGSGDSFKTIKVSGQGDLVAVSNDVLEIAAGPGIVITTAPTGGTYKTITFEAVNTGATLDGGGPDSVYGGLPVIDGGSI